MRVVVYRPQQGLGASRDGEEDQQRHCFAYRDGLIADFLRPFRDAVGNDLEVARRA